MLRGAGVPAGWDGALRFPYREGAAVATIVFAYQLFGWCVDHDVILIPDHGRQLLQTDHHGVIHVECRTEPRILQFVDHMAAEGYDLPTRLPDPTFKRPAWMDAAGS
jgi:hypothetical protein